VPTPWPRWLHNLICAMNPIHSIEPIIRLDQIRKSFVTSSGSLHAIDGVSLHIRSGEVFGIIGKSGAGKSSLLRIINLLERPDAGQVFVAGQELTGLSKVALRSARQHIGMIFQQFNLLQNLTVADNVALPLRLHHAARKEIQARVLECLEVVGLSEKAGSYPAQLSGGQKQRVAIARALANRPAVLLCDEPTSALDPETTRSVLDVLKEINLRYGVTIVIVTHEMAVVRSICRQVAVMDAGKIIEQFSVDTAPGDLQTPLAREVAYA